jgi:ATP-dependent DNA helicase PIF1
MLIKNIDETLVNGSLGNVIAFMDEKTFDFYHEDEEEFQAVESMDVNDEDMSRSRKKLKAMLNKDLVADTAGKWPLVRFAMPDGTSRDLLCQPEPWKIELPNGEVQASRSQIPLFLRGPVNSQSTGPNSRTRQG